MSFSTVTLAGRSPVLASSATDMMLLINDLQGAISYYNLALIKLKSKELIDAGRVIVLQHIQQDHSFNPLPMAITLLEASASDYLQWEDITKYQLVKLARLFIELSSMKATLEKRQLYFDTQTKLRDQLDKIMSVVDPKQVTFKYELQCCSEALKLMENVKWGEYFVTILNAVIDPGIGSISTLVGLIQELHKKKSQGWFFDALYVNWFGPLARQNPQLFKEIADTFETSLSSPAMGITAVEFMNDIIWNGVLELQLEAVLGDFGLITLLHKHLKYQLFASDDGWEVRYYIIQVLLSLKAHPNGQIVEIASNALLFCQQKETHPTVLKHLQNHFEPVGKENDNLLEYKLMKIQQIIANIEKITTHSIHNRIIDTNEETRGKIYPIHLRLSKNVGFESMVRLLIDILGPVSIRAHTMAQIGKREKTYIDLTRKDARKLALILRNSNLSRKLLSAAMAYI